MYEFSEKVQKNGNVYLKFLKPLPRSSTLH